MAADFLADKIAHADLTGYVAIEDDAAETLASVGKVETRSYNQYFNIFAPDIKTLSEKAARALSQHEGNLCFESLESLELGAARWLAQSRCQQLNLSSLADISEPVIYLLGSFQGDSLSLGLKGLSARAAEVLSQRIGSLGLDALKTLSDQAAEALSFFMPNAWLSLDGLTELTDISAAALAKRNGWLSVNGLKNISTNVALSLATLKVLQTNAEVRKCISKSKRRVKSNPEPRKKNKPSAENITKKTKSYPFGCSQEALVSLRGPVLAIKSNLSDLSKNLRSKKCKTIRASIELVTGVDSGEWLLAEYTQNILAPNAAIDVSRLLNTQIMFLYHDDSSGTLGYNLYDKGVLIEALQMIDSEFIEFLTEADLQLTVNKPLASLRVESEGFMICFKSKISRAKKNALTQGAAKFIDSRFKEIGIYIPDVWPL